MLTGHCQETADYVPRLISTVRKSQSSPEDLLMQTELVHVCGEFVDPCTRLANSARSAVPSVSDQAAAMHLSQCTQLLAESIAELRTALTSAREEIRAAPLELDNAIQLVKGLDYELVEFRKAALEGRLLPVPGETVDGSSAQLASSTKAVGSSMAQLLSATVQGDEQHVALSARDATEGLRQLTGGIHGVCATRREAPAER